MHSNYVEKLYGPTHGLKLNDTIKDSTERSQTLKYSPETANASLYTTRKHMEEE